MRRIKEFELGDVACDRCGENMLQAETTHPVRNAVMTFDRKTGYSGKWFEYEQAEGMKARDYEHFRLVCLECGSVRFEAGTDSTGTAIRKLEKHVLQMHRSQNP